MKIAIPTAAGKLAMHFGHCEKFTIYDVNDNKVENKVEEIPPPHEPGVLPKWLGEKEVNVIIAGGMGQRAQQLFAANDIKVIVGAQAEDTDMIIENYISGSLSTGENCCDH